MSRLGSGRRGMTLIEVLIGAVLLGLTAAFSLQALDNLNASKTRAFGLQGRSDIVYSLLENLRENVAYYQTSFEEATLHDEESLDLLLPPDALPYAWSQSRMSTPEECPECPGRYGYVIQPVKGKAALYRITIRLSNPEVFTGLKDYQFITTIK